MRACERWAANDFLARNGVPLMQACDHDPTDCPPHRQERTMTDQPDPTRCDGCTWTDRTPPAAPTTGDPYDTDLGDFAMTADQEIRARALDSAARLLAPALKDIPATEDDVESLASRWVALADRGAAYIRDGARP